MPGTLTRTRATAHAACRLCGSAPAGIPQLDFQPSADGGVEATFTCDPTSQGYDGHVHGGIAAAICDAALCNALFAHGIVALTAQLSLRYRQTLRLDEPARVSARFTGCRAGAWQASACIHQQGRAVEAEAFFLPPRSVR